MTGRDRFVWEADLRPSPISDVYHVRMEGKPWVFPKVWVSGGAIDRCEDLSSIPHQFGYEEDSKQVKACLQIGNWSPEDRLSRTALQWVNEWLVHLEIWMATGKWCGGGKHPSTDEARTELEGD